MPDGIRLGGAYYELTADDSKLLQSLARSQSQARSFSEAIGKSMGSASSATDQSMKKMAASTQQASAGFASLAKSAAGFGVAAVGVASAAATVHNAIGGIIESTKAAQQAQFALSKTYGQSAPEMAKFAKDFGDQIGRSTSQVMQSAVIVGNLTKEYGLNQAQAQELIRVAADLAAVYGKDLPDATQRLQAAIRGEAEAAEALGLVLNDQAVATRQLGADGEKLWSKLTDGEKATLRLAEAMKQLADRQGAADERAKGALGNFDRLTKATDELGAALGDRLLPPASAVAGVLATMATNATGALTALTNLASLDLTKLSQLAGILAVIVNPVGGTAALIASGVAVPNPSDIQIGPDPGMPGSTTPGSTSDARRAAAAAQTAANVAAIKRKAEILAQLDDADKANKALLAAQLKAIDAERKAKEQWYDEEKQRIEARRTYQLEDIETRKRAALDALAAEKQATLDAIDDQIKAQERAKQSRLDAAEAAADAAKAAIAAQEQQLELARELEDRARSDERKAEDRARDDTRRAEDRRIKESQEAEIRGLEALTEARKEAVEQGIALLEKATEKRIRALDREADRARTNGDAALARLERQGEAEDENHRKRMQALEDEQDARLEILDAQLRALDAEEHAADAARRTADLQQRIAAATKAQTAARGTGTPEQIAEARAELTRAFRVGDELSIANAKERLLQLAGQGNEAIEKADEELAKAQQDLRDEGVDAARDAEKLKLEAAKDAVKEEIDGRKRAEEDDARGRKQELERAQEHERERLKTTVDRIEKQKQAEQDKAKDEKQLLQDGLEADQKAAAEQIRITRDRFEQEGQALQDARAAEDRLREDAREAEDRERQDARAAQDADLARQLAAVASTLEAERKETEAHYNGPNGIITQLKAAREASEREYAARLQAVTRSYEEERKAAERKYHNPEGNGELDLLEKQRTAEMAALAARKTEYEEQAAAFHQMTVDMIADIDAFIAKQQSIPKPGGGSGSPGSGSRTAGSGKATSASSTSSTSGKSGKQVQGTSGTWINDAMDITGVGDDWAGGLNTLMQLESGGDPHNQNKEDVISNGVNYGPAKGLFQMLQSTFAANRDKDLPNDIFDPVANAVAAIRYIKQRYGHVDKAVANHAARGGYDAGGMIREPVIGYGVRSGQPYAIAEHGPEYVLGRRATSAMLGGGAGSASAGLGGFLAGAHPGSGGVAAVVNEGDVIFNGLTYEQATSRQRREQHRRQLLRGAGRLH